MDDSIKLITTELIKLFPENDLGKLAVFALIALLILTATGRFKLEWIGKGAQHIYRWLRCKVSDRHYFKAINPFAALNGLDHQRLRCKICGKTEVRP